MYIPLLLFYSIFINENNTGMYQLRFIVIWIPHVVACECFTEIVLDLEGLQLCVLCDVLAYVLFDVHVHAVCK